MTIYIYDSLFSMSFQYRLMEWISNKIVVMECHEKNAYERSWKVMENHFYYSVAVDCHFCCSYQ